MENQPPIDTNPLPFDEASATETVFKNPAIETLARGSISEVQFAAGLCSNIVELMRRKNTLHADYHRVQARFFKANRLYIYVSLIGAAVFAMSLAPLVSQPDIPRGETLTYIMAAAASALFLIYLPNRLRETKEAQFRKQISAINASYYFTVEYITRYFEMAQEPADFKTMINDFTKLYDRFDGQGPPPAAKPTLH